VSEDGRSARVTGKRKVKGAGFVQFVSGERKEKGRADVAEVGDNKRTERIARSSVQFVQASSS
jgi:hypothetical protein